MENVFASAISAFSSKRPPLRSSFRISGLAAQSIKGKKVTPMTTEFITTPGGEKLAILPAEEYKDMRDALVHQRAMSDYRAGRVGALTLDEVQALLTAPTPLAFWRAKRGMTQAALAKSAGTTQPHVADLESGKHGGSLEIMARIAAALDISVDSLVAAD
jgi:DNA-binding XRE family transcriptional regulator